MYQGYPNTPHPGKTDTSREAAEAIAPSVPTLREQVMTIMRERDSTADECAEALNVSILAIRPRVAENVTLNKLMDSGVRRKNASGRSAIVWKPVPEQSSFDFKEPS